PGITRLTPPNATIAVELVELLSTYPPVTSRRWSLDDPARRSCNGIDTCRIHIACGKITKQPRTTGVIIGIGVARQHIFRAREEIGPPYIRRLCIDQNVVVVFT